MLTNLSYSLNGSGNSLLCIDDLIVSDTDGNSLLTGEDCTTVDFASGNASFSFGDISSDSMAVYMSSSVDVSGFQFTITDYPDLITVTGANGGSAEQYGFEVSTSELGIVIGFSFTGGTIPAGDGLLTNISYTNSDSGNTELCITDTIVSDENGGGLLSSGDCIDVEISDVEPGDINNDGILNVQDVVIMINYILGGVYDSNGDINNDGIINVQDVVILINLILA